MATSIPSALSTVPSPTPAPMAFVNFNGQQVRNDQTYMDNLTAGGERMGISAQEYDKWLNPTTYMARWGGETTPLDATATADLQSKGLVAGADGSYNLTGAAGGSSGGSTPGIVQQPLSGTSVMSANTERIGAPTKWNVTEDQTVQGQIARIIDPNNPLFQQATTASNEAMNQRGIVNSSIAQSAAQDALYRTALPIAQADAATYGKAAGYNADMPNQIAIKNAEMGNTVNMANLNANNSWAQANLASTTQLANTQMNNDTNRDVASMNASSAQAIASMNADSQQRIAQLDAGIRLQVQQLANDNQTLLTTSGQAATAFNQYLVSATNIQNNKDLDATNKKIALAQLWETTRTQLAVLSAVSGLKLTDDLDMTGLEGYDSTGKWVGFNPDGTTKTAPGATPEPTPAPVSGEGGGSGWVNPFNP